jgi:hypothetical protein
MILKLVRHERPIFYFGLLAGVFSLLSLILIAPVVEHYFVTGLVPRLPTAVLSMGLMIIAILSLMVGAILDTVTRGRRELRMLAYLQYPIFSGPDCATRVESARLSKDVAGHGNA